MSRRLSSLLFGALVLFTVATCGPSGRSGGGGGGGGNGCPASCKNCDPQGACHDCVAGQTACRSDTVVNCNGDGTFGTQVKECDVANNQRCTGGTCLSPCDVAASSHSYIGCDYWPTTTLTSQLNPEFDFAVAVANPLAIGDVVQSAPATITVTIGDQEVAKKTVMPGEVETIILPWVESLSQPPTGGARMEKSALVPDGAYHLVSSIPVTVYQFSPLQFEKPSNAKCQDQLGGPTCHSYTNDASILLPSTALQNDYLIISRQTFALVRPGAPTTPIPGFFAVVATENNTVVNVIYSANTEGGTNVPAQKAGSKTSYTLQKGTVLEVVSQRAVSPCVNTAKDLQATYCDLGPKYDLTGTRVTADKPIAVFGGHACSFVPYNKWACDHLEEQLTPLDTWGKKVIVVQTEPQIKGEKNVFRIISGKDGNAITFDPPVYKSVTLNSGQYVEFIADGGFQVEGSERLAVGQFMIGENAVNDQGTPDKVGDPAFGLGVPVEQFRNNYDFLTPESYTKSYVNVIAPIAASLRLDNMPFPGPFTAIGSTGFGYKRLLIDPGAHHMTGDVAFGITVSGIANFTSYLYVGGQNLNQINPG